MGAYREEDLLPLSGIQHFAFCKRQWALIHLEQQWSENVRTTEGHFLHEKVDDPYIMETRGVMIISRSMPLVSYNLGLYGIADMVEYMRTDDPNGVKLEGHEGYWAPSPIEYKRGKPKADDRDDVQLYAQALCLEEMYKITIKQGFIYYGQTRHRIDVIFDERLRLRVFELSEEMHRMFTLRVTPPAPKGVNCKLCSLVDLCMPNLTRNKKSASKYLTKALKDIREEKE